MTARPVLTEADSPADGRRGPLRAALWQPGATALLSQMPNAPRPALAKDFRRFARRVETSVSRTLRGKSAMSDRLLVCPNLGHRHTGAAPCPTVPVARWSSVLFSFWVTAHPPSPMPLTAIGVTTTAAASRSRRPSSSRRVGPASREITPATRSSILAAERAPGGKPGLDDPARRDERRGSSGRHEWHGGLAAVLRGDDLSHRRLPGRAGSGVNPSKTRPNEISTQRIAALPSRARNPV